MYDCYQFIPDVKVHNRRGYHIQILAGSMTLACLKLLSRKTVLGVFLKALQKSGLAMSESTNAEN